MSKRANSSKRKNTPKLVKAAQGVTLPAVAKAAKAMPMPAILIVVGACAVGALALFVFSGPAGQRRRALIRDKALQASREVGEVVSKGGREVRQRLESVATGATQRLRGGRSETMSNGRTDQRMGEQPLHV